MQPSPSMKYPSSMMMSMPNPELVPRAKNQRELSREFLVQVLSFFSELIPGRFNNRPVRLVVHGGACMLLHPVLYKLAQEQPPMGPYDSPESYMPRRISTRDVDILRRSFDTEWREIGVNDASERLNECIRITAIRFGLGLDWMNSDADIALPMTVDPSTGLHYDPIYRAAIQQSNIDLHTIFASQNGSLTLISVTPFWAVALKLVRYSKWDPGDICILLRNGSLLANVKWTPQLLESWLNAHCSAMGYSAYDNKRRAELQSKILHAINMVWKWAGTGAEEAAAAQSQQQKQAMWNNKPLTGDVAMGGWLTMPGTGGASNISAPMIPVIPSTSSTPQPSGLTSTGNGSSSHRLHRHTPSKSSLPSMPMPIPVPMSHPHSHSSTPQPHSLPCLPVPGLQLSAMPSHSSRPPSVMSNMSGNMLAPPMIPLSSDLHRKSQSISFPISSSPNPNVHGTSQSFSSARMTLPVPPGNHFELMDGSIARPRSRSHSNSNTHSFAQPSPHGQQFTTRIRRPLSPVESQSTSSRPTSPSVSSSSSSSRSSSAASRSRRRPRSPYPHSNENLFIPPLRSRTPSRSRSPLPLVHQTQIYAQPQSLQPPQMQMMRSISPARLPNHTSSTSLTNPTPLFNGVQGRPRSRSISSSSSSPRSSSSSSSLSTTSPQSNVQRGNTISSSLPPNAPNLIMNGPGAWIYMDQERDRRLSTSSSASMVSQSQSHPTMTQRHSKNKPLNASGISDITPSRQPNPHHQRQRANEHQLKIEPGYGYGYGVELSPNRSGSGKPKGLRERDRLGTIVEGGTSGRDRDKGRDQRSPLVREREVMDRESIARERAPMSEFDIRNAKRKEEKETREQEERRRHKERKKERKAKLRMRVPQNEYDYDGIHAGGGTRTSASLGGLYALPIGQSVVPQGSMGMMQGAGRGASPDTDSSSGGSDESETDTDSDDGRMHRRSGSDRDRARMDISRSANADVRPDTKHGHREKKSNGNHSSSDSEGTDSSLGSRQRHHSSQDSRQPLSRAHTSPMGQAPLNASTRPRLRETASFQIYGPPLPRSNTPLAPSGISAMINPPTRTGAMSRNSNMLLTSASMDHLDKPLNNGIPKTVPGANIPVYPRSTSTQPHLPSDNSQSKSQAQPSFSGSAFPNGTIGPTPSITPSGLLAPPPLAFGQSLNALARFPSMQQQSQPPQIPNGSNMMMTSAQPQQFMPSGMYQRQHLHQQPFQAQQHQHQTPMSSHRNQIHAMGSRGAVGPASASQLPSMSTPQEKEPTPFNALGLTI